MGKRKDEGNCWSNDIGETEEIPVPTSYPAISLDNILRYQYDMSGLTKSCVDKYLDFNNQDVSSLRKVATPCMDDHQFAREDFVSKGELSTIACRVVLKRCGWRVCLAHTCFGRCITWPVKS